MLPLVHKASNSSKYFSIVFVSRSLPRLKMLYVVLDGVASRQLKRVIQLRCQTVRKNGRKLWFRIRCQWISESDIFNVQGISWFTLYRHEQVFYVTIKTTLGLEVKAVIIWRWHTDPSDALHFRHYATPLLSTIILIMLHDIGSMEFFIWILLLKMPLIEWRNVGPVRQKATGLFLLKYVK